MVLPKLVIRRSQLRTKSLLLFLASTVYVLGGLGSTIHATEPEFPPDSDSGSSANQQQIQNQEQFQNQRQRQGDNRVDVDGDDNDYLALAIPNLVAANCAGQSYSLGAGGAGFGFGLGQATIDENCQIAKAIATAHLLQKTGLVHLHSYEYRHALCQMRGMEHVCKGKKHHGKPVCVRGKKHKSYPGWCSYRIGRDTKPSKWSGRDLRACGLERATFHSDIENWGTEEYCEPDPHEKPTKYKPKHKRKTKKRHIAVRTGKHCGYDRVVFDWPKPVGYKIERWEDKVVVDFNRTRKIDVSHVPHSLGRFVLDAYSEKHAEGTRVIFAVSDDVKHRVWTWDHRVIVDVIKKPGCSSG
ncbi:MAG: hypothetical protein ACR2P3_09255 [Geminicoccaceae bacterium]